MSNTNYCLIAPHFFFFFFALFVSFSYFLLLVIFPAYIVHTLVLVGIIRKKKRLTAELLVLKWVYTMYFELGAFLVYCRCEE